MENCNVKMIAGCTVYSYDVECPIRPSAPVAKAVVPVEKKNGLISRFMQIFIMMMMPFALLVDGAAAFIRSAYRFAANHTVSAKVIGTLSSFVLLTTVLIML